MPSYPPPPLDPTAPPGTGPYSPPAYGAPPPPGYGGGYPPGGYGYPAPGYGYGYDQPKKTDGTAIAALVLAIVSFVFGLGIPAIVALALIPGSRRRIAASNGTLKGSSLLTAAKWVAIANLIYTILVVGIIALVVAGLSSSSSSLGHVVLPMRPVW